MKKIGRVYFITNELRTGIKIGFTNKAVEVRLNQLKTGSNEKLEVLYVIENSSMDYERYLHKYFGNEYKTRQKSEWFDYEMVWKWIKRDKLEKEILRQEGII